MRIACGALDLSSSRLIHIFSQRHEPAMPQLIVANEVFTLRHFEWRQVKRLRSEKSASPL